MQCDFCQTELVSKARDLGIELTQQQSLMLIKYATLLLKWNQTYNLTSICKPEDVINIHLVDSLAMVAVFNQRFPDVVNVLDVGSGGGLPAIPLAIMRPDIHVTATDAVKKKVLFLRQASIVAGLKNFQAEHIRVETIHTHNYDVITSRAFATLANTVSWTRDAISENGCWLSMKAKVTEEELKEVPADVVVSEIVPMHVPGENLTRNLVVLKLKK